MSKPALQPVPIAVPAFKRPGMAPATGDQIGLMLTAIHSGFDRAQETNKVEDWSALDQLVLDLKHLTHLKFLEARQSCEICDGKR